MNKLVFILLLLLKKSSSQTNRGKHDALLKTSSNDTRDNVYLELSFIVMKIIRFFILLPRKRYIENLIERKECFYPNAQRTI